LSIVVIKSLVLSVYIFNPGKKSNMDFKFYKKGERRENKETYQDMYYKNYVLLYFRYLFLFYSNLYI